MRYQSSGAGDQSARFCRQTASKAAENASVHLTEFGLVATTNSGIRA